jgi:16S rRNA (guanine966-N2)-methyltransferase
MLEAMRVIAGRYRSRMLTAPHGFSTRPTSDRLRETLFNVLASRIDGARFADLYAGSGAVGIEAVSRGAVLVAFAEIDRAALLVLRQNLQSLRIASGITIEQLGTRRLLEDALKAGTAFDIVFLDPPYEAAREYADTLQWLANPGSALLRDGALVVAEHSTKVPLAEVYGEGATRLLRTRVLRQGDASLSFYAVELAAEIEDDLDEEQAA